MRKLGYLGVLVLALVFPCAANADWQGSSPWDVAYPFTYPQHLKFDPFNAGLMYSDSESAPSGGWFGQSLDGGVEWDATGSLPPGGKHFDVAFNDQGGRVWAYSASSDSIAVTRGSSLGGPTDAPVTKFVTAPGVTDLKITVSPLGDVLLGWTGDTAGVAFWPAADESPGTPQIVGGSGDGCDSSANPLPFLDPQGSATFAWTCSTSDKTVMQATAADASETDGFGAESVLAGGELVGGGQSNDGRAVVLIKQSRTIPENAEGATTTDVLSYASRRAGADFGAATDLAGDSDTRLEYVSRTVAVTPSGRVLIGFATTANQDPPKTCSDPDHGTTNLIATGSIDADSGALSLVAEQLSANTMFSGSPAIAIGRDGRLAYSYSTYQSCGIKAVLGERIFLALDGEHFEEIDNPYVNSSNLSQFSFTAKGQLFIVAIQPAGPYLDFSNLYDTALPLTPLARSASNGTSGGVNSKSTETSTVRPTLKLLSIKRRTHGSLTVTLKTNTPGRFRLVVRRGRTVIATASSRATVGITRVRVKLKFSSAKHLKRLGRLQAKLTTSFAPDTGVAPTSVTRRVTFKK